MFRCILLGDKYFITAYVCGGKKGLNILRVDGVCWTGESNKRGLNNEYFQTYK